MKIEFDINKSLKNEKERKLPFSETEKFDWENAIYFKDDRFQYSEERIVAIGFIDIRLHVICFTPINGGVRIISFRKANKREVKYYEKKIADQ